MAAEKKRECIVSTAQGWFEAARGAQKSGDAFAAVLFMENAFNHTENALAAVLRDRGHSTTESMRAELARLAQC
jgi:hypothetical protein